MSYHGRERRIHRVYATRNTEYHLRRRLCVGVRDRRTGEWMRGHMAVDAEVSGGLRFHRQGGVVPTEELPRVGESLFFCARGRDLVTSPVERIERPERHVTADYQQ